MLCPANDLGTDAPSGTLASRSAAILAANFCADEETKTAGRQGSQVDAEQGSRGPGEGRSGDQSSLGEQTPALQEKRAAAEATALL